MSHIYRYIGSFGWAETDVTVSGGAMPLAFTRYYAAYADRLGSMGYRWRHIYDTELYIGVDQDLVVVLFVNGTEEAFAKQTNGTYLPDDSRVRSSLEVQTIGIDTFYVYTTRDEMVYTFSDLGLLESITDPNGNTIDLADDANDRLETVSTSGDRSLTLTYNVDGRLESVSGTGGETVTYEYDAAGDLAGVERPDDVDLTERMEYVYSRHRLKEVKQRQGTDLTTNPTMVTIVRNDLDSYNRVVSQRDALNNSLDLIYQDPADGVTTVEDKTDDDAETKFYFDGFGRTTHVVTPLGQITQYFYDTAGNMTKWIDGAGGEYEFKFDAAGDLEWVDDPLNRRTNMVFNAQHLPTEVTDALGVVTTHDYDAAGNELKQVIDVGDPLDGHLNLTTEWTYDDDGNLTREVIDPGDPLDGHLNLTSAYTYSNSGRMLTRTIDPDDLDNPLPAPHLDLTWTYTYTSAGDLASEIDPGGMYTRYTYSGRGRLATVTVDPHIVENPLPGPHLSLATRYVYDLIGNLIIARDPVCTELGGMSCQTEWYYDQRGLVRDKYDGVDTRRSYEYDANGQMTRSVVDPTDPNEPGDELNLVTSYVYDADGRLFQTITDPDNPNVTGDELALITQYEYDDAGRLEHEIVDPTDPNRSGDELNLTTTYQYDDAGRLTGKELPDGAVWTYTYDELGRMTDVTDPVLNVTHYEYDAAGRRTATIVDPGTGNLNLTTTTEYDAAGRVIATTDAEGVRTENEYDRASRLLQTTVDPGSSPHLNLTTSYEYNPNGSIANVTDPAGRITYHEYDNAGRLIETTEPGPRVTTYWYDENGRQTGSQSPSGLVTETTYDLRGLVTKTVVDPNPSGQSGHLALTTSSTYDPAGRRTKTTNPRGKITSYAYDAASRLTSITDPALPTAGTVSFTHDRAGRVTDVLNARGYTSSFVYDEMGRVVEATDPLDRSHTYDYNGLGQITRHLDPDGNDIRSFYDGANRLTEMTDGGSTTYASYGYDDNGRIVSTSNYNGAIGTTYDAVGRVTQVSSPEGTVGYTYNSASQRTSMTLPGSRTITYTYGTVGQLETVTDWNTQTTTYGYTTDGLLASIERANDVDSLYEYDDANRLVAISHFDPLDVPLAEYGYTLDKNGNRIETVITGSAVTNATETYAYDELDRLTDVEYDDGLNPLETYEYAYDANGNRISVTSGSTTTTATFDQADQLTDLGGLTMTYDPNGNRLTAGSDTYTYDWANRLTQATVSSTTTDVTYLADGTRQSVTSGSSTTDYLYDREAGLPQVVSDGTTSYVRGTGLTAEIDNTSGGATTPLADGLGSIRARTDETGTAIGTADWDAWGNLRASWGVTGSFGWTGEQQDASTGLTYLRSRYLDPFSARFLTRDVISPNTDGTQGYSGYAYADGNPVTFTDPGGASVLRGFAILAVVFYCILKGECKYQRRHNDDDYNPIREAIEGTSSAGRSSASPGSTAIGLKPCQPGTMSICKARTIPQGPYKPTTLDIRIPKICLFCDWVDGIFDAVGGFVKDHLTPGGLGACGSATGAFKLNGDPGIFSAGIAALCGWFFRNGDYGLTFTYGGAGAPTSHWGGVGPTLDRWLRGGAVLAGQAVITSNASMEQMEGCTTGAGVAVGRGGWVASGDLQWTLTEQPEWTIGLGRGVIIGGTNEGEFFAGTGGCTEVITESNLPSNWENLVDSDVARIIGCSMAPDRQCLKNLNDFFRVI